MARRLPWLAPPSKVTAEKKQKPGASRKLKRHSDELDNMSDSGSDLAFLPSVISNKASPEPLAEPSSSPVQPKEEEMKAGFNADDAWIMVEDEFLSTAHLFTARLHREEYHRRAELARARGSSRTHTFPTDNGRTQLSGLTKAKTMGTELRKKRKVALKNIFGVTRGVDDEADEARDGYNLDPKLSELMAENKTKHMVIKPTLLSSPARPFKHAEIRNGELRKQEKTHNEIVNVDDSTTSSDQDLDVTELKALPIAVKQAKMSLSKKMINSNIKEQRSTSLHANSSSANGASETPASLLGPKRAAMNPKIQLLLAKRKAEAAGVQISAKTDL